MPIDQMAFQKLYNDPNFQKLPYYTQQEVRAKILQQQLQTDPGFQRLAGDAKTAVVQKLSDRFVTKAPPAFENPMYYQMMDSKVNNAIFKPFVSKSIISKGIVGTFTGIEELMKLVGILPKTWVNQWQTNYSQDQVKLTEWTAAKMGKPQLPYTMATVGEVADWIGLSAIGGAIGGAVRGTTVAGRGAITAGKLAASQVAETGLRGMILRGAAKTAAMSGAGGLVGGLFEPTGVGATRAITTWLGKAVAGDVAKGLGSAIGKFVVKGGSSKLLSMGAREYLFNVVGAQLVRSTGAGLAGVAAGYVHGAATPDIPWAEGTKLTFDSTAKTFGSFAAMDFLMNLAMNSMAPFIGLVGKTLTKGGMAVDSIKDVAKFSVDQLEEYTRRLKLGIMDDVVWTGLPDSVKDHLSSRVFFEKVVANGAGAVTHDPVSTTKAISFLLNHDVVDAPLAAKLEDLPSWLKDRISSKGLKTTDQIFSGLELKDPALVSRITSDASLSAVQKEALLKSGTLPSEGGFYRIRTAPGTTVKQIINDELHDIKGSTVIADQVRLPEVNRIIAERYQEARGALELKLAAEERDFAKLVEKGPDIAGLEPEQAKLAELVHDEKLNSMRQKILGMKITQAAYDQFDPYIQPVVNSIESAKGGYVVDLVEGSMPANERSAISYGEASAVQQKPNVKTMRFRVDLPQGQLSGKEARLVRLGTQVTAARDIKDFFVRQSTPFKVTPAEGDFNALLVYSKPANERIVQQQYMNLKHLKTPSSLDELVQARLQSLGFDAIEHADGSVTSLFPRVQIKHVSDMIDVKTGRYRAGFDKAYKPAASIRKGPGLNPNFLSSLGKEVHIKQSLRIPISNKELTQSDTALISLMKQVYGPTRSELVKKVAEIYLEKYGVSAKGLKVHVVHDLPIEDISFRTEGTDRVLKVPAEIRTVKEQYDFIDKLGKELFKENTYGKTGTDRLQRLWRAVGISGEFPGGVPDLEELGVKGLKSGVQAKLLEGLSEKLQNPFARDVAVKNIYASPLPDAPDADKIKWLEAAAKESKTAAFIPVDKRVPNEKMMTLQFLDGSSASFKNIDEAIDEFLVRNTSEAVLRNELADAMGYTLKKSQDGKLFEVFDNKTVVASADSIPSLLKEMNFRPSRIDSVFAPTTVLVGPKGVEFQMNGKIAIGSLPDARRLLDRYVDPAVEATRKTVLKTEVGKLSQHFDESWEVEIPGWGIRKKFTGPSAPFEARGYLEGRYQDYLEIERISNERGYMLRYQDGRYKLIDETGTFWAKDKDEVGKILARSPDPSFAPNLIPEIDEKTMSAFVQEAKAAYAPDFWVLPGLKDGTFNQKELGLTNLSQNILPLHHWLMSYAKKSGQTKVAELYNGLETSLREAHRQINEVRRLGLYHLSDTVAGKNGKTAVKLFPEDKLKGMLHYLEQTTDEGRLGVKDIYKLEDKHINGALQIRELLGTDPIKNPGLFGKFGIDTNAFLFGYMPRIKEAAAKLGRGPGLWKTLNDSNIDEFLGEVFQGKANIPTEFRFWAENERLSDLVDFAREENLAKVFLRYNDRGHMKFFLNEQWRSLDDYIKNAPIKIGEQAQDVMNRYREMVMGTFSTNLDRGAAQFGRYLAIKTNGAANAVRKAFGKEVHALSPQAGENLADLLFTSTTFTTQSFRFWLTARNMTQIYTTGGAVLGNQWIDIGQKRVLADPEGAVSVLKQRGTLSEAPPLLNEVAKGESKVTKAIGKMTEVGMTPTKKSDDLSRAVVYFAAEERWNHYYKFKEKIPDFNFEKEAGVNLLHDDVGAKVQQLLKQGSPEAIATARHLYADDMQRLTMFDYTKANSPRSFHGLLGKAFGQYQVYPVYYMAMIKHMFSHGTPGQKIGMIARLGINAIATAGALQLIGLDGKNALPWVPAQLSGGPFASIAWNILQSTNTTSYKGAAARGELAGTLPRLIPGSYEYRMIKDFTRYMSEGKVLQAIYALSSAPIRSDLR